MPAISKFTAERRRIVVEHLAAGCSRRRAAQAAGIDHQTLARWIERGKKGAPGGRWREFYEAVELAETGSPILVSLKRQYEAASPAWVRKYLEAEQVEWKLDDPTPPLEVVVTFAPPITEGDPA